MQNSEKLCLQWNDFKSNIRSAFSELRKDQDFADVTLACEDGQQILAHKVILASSIRDQIKDFKDSGLLKETQKTTNKVAPSVSNKLPEEYKNIDQDNTERQIAQTNSTVNVNLSELDAQVKSMMATSDVNRASNGKRATICTVCGKEGQWGGIRDHIEANHITGVSHSCNICGNMFKTRITMGQHMRIVHK